VEFGLTGIVPGTYVVRLRVDGVDSLPISMPFPSAPAPLAFDSAQQVVVT
jgi:hypothetical protein